MALRRKSKFLRKKTPSWPGACFTLRPHLSLPAPPLNLRSSLTKLPAPQTGHTFLLPPSFAQGCCFCLEHSPFQPSVSCTALRSHLRHLFLQEAFPGAPRPRSGLGRVQTYSGQPLKSSTWVYQVSQWPVQSSASPPGRMFHRAVTVPVWIPVLSPASSMAPGT